MTEQQERMVVPAQIVKHDEVVRNQDNYDKVYLMLLVFVDEDDQITKDFILKRGRKECYDYLKDLVINERGFSISDSKVLANGAQLGDEINAGKFLRFLKDKFFIEDEFDVNDYFHEEDYIGEDLDQLIEE